MLVPKRIQKEINIIEEI